MSILLFFVVALLIVPPFMWGIMYINILPQIEGDGKVVYTKEEQQRKVRKRTFRSNAFKYWVIYAIGVFVLLSRI